jgi:hypothetical protein
MNGFSLDALGHVFGGGWFERVTHAALSACPLALGALSMEQLFGSYPQRSGKLLHGPWVSSSPERLKLLDGGVSHTGELTELPLGEASSTTMLSKARQRSASGSLDHLYSPCCG